MSQPTVAIWPVKQKRAGDDVPLAGPSADDAAPDDCKCNVGVGSQVTSSDPVLQKSPKAIYIK